MRRWFATLAALFCLSASAPPAPVALDVVLAESPAPKLSDYRLFTDRAGREPNARVTLYHLNTPLFSDYAFKHRYLYLPPGKAVAYRSEGVLEFPVGAVLVKTFSFGADLRDAPMPERYVETRLLIRKAEGWVALAYVWNAEETEAVLKRAGTRVPVSFVDDHGRGRQLDYAVPNQNQCKECHQLDKTLVPLGPKARNLNVEIYGQDRDNQLARWTRLGLLTGTPSDRKAIPRTPQADSPFQTLDARARAYLDANCAHCHNARAAASNSGLFLELEAPSGPSLGIMKGPVAAGRGSGGLSWSVKPGDPDASILAYRMASTEPGVMMPELGRSVRHEEGLELIRAWIAAMPSRP